MKLLLLALFLVIQPIQDIPKPDIPCSVIAQFVWKYGPKAALLWAKANGYSDNEIAAMKRRCAKS